MLFGLWMTLGDRMTTSPLMRHEPGTPWSIVDLKALPDDDTNRYEIYCGSLLVTPRGYMPHGLVVSRLHRLLLRQAPGGLMVGAGLGVSDNVASYFIPALLVVPETALAEDGDALHPAEVLVVVEVLSPSNARYDLVVKRDEYAIAGIPLYWIVDPKKQTLTVLELADDGTYRDAAVVEPGQVWRTDTPFPLAFDLAEIF
ncbi:Uma2 family endonuclease [Phytohabitans sp. LJ34]|uniref:Uma2 family endonuclease n=1 Tax=Phytohabitans sp. LJ34 TaxID=3452217 RepID=UPI003F8B7CBE